MPCGTITSSSRVLRNLCLTGRLDLKGHNLIKGIHLEGLRVIGSPDMHALRYYEQGADELSYMDCVTSLYGLENTLTMSGPMQVLDAGLVNTARSSTRSRRFSEEAVFRQQYG